MGFLLAYGFVSGIISCVYSSHDLKTVGFQLGINKASLDMFRYFSEVLLLTKSDNECELECWLHWYLDVVKFDHVVIFDNESSIDIPSLLRKFPEDKIEYHFIEGWKFQYSIYDEYLKEPKSQWSITLDDDEYIYISQKYKGNVNCMLESLYKDYGANKFYSLWTHFYSKDPLEVQTEPLINTHLYYSYKIANHMNPPFGVDNRIGKCFINNSQKFLYNTSDCIYAHIPKCLDGDNRTVLIRNGNILNRERSCCYVFDTLFVDCFIGHFQFKSSSFWYKKCHRSTVTHKNHIITYKAPLYNQLYTKKDLFIYNPLFKDSFSKGEPII